VLSRRSSSSLTVPRGVGQNPAVLARTASALALVAVLTASCGDRLTAVPSQAVATATARPTTLSLSELIRSGKIRVAFNRLNITCIQTVPYGEAGVCVDMARELATGMQVQLEISQFDTGGRLTDAGRAGDWDIAFVNLDLNFPQPGLAPTSPFLELDQTYLVRGNAPFHSTADVDSPGVRITTFTPSAIEVFLRRNLKFATVVDATSIAHGVRLIEEGQADVYAASRAELVDGGWRLADGRVLADSITSFRWAIAVADGRADLLTYVSQFLESAKRTGFIERTIQKYKVAGARVAL